MLSPLLSETGQRAIPNLNSKTNQVIVYSSAPSVFFLTFKAIDVALAVSG